MKKITYLFCLIVGISIQAMAQNQANNWYFGRNAGITFNTTPPTALTDGALNTSEGCASISNSAGSLLFYTDGITVYNKNHAIMPNGTGLKGDPSAAQSAIIIPKPGSTTNFYIITVPETGTVGMCYSEVDMSLSGGMGDVIVSNKNTFMFASSSEKVTVVKHANGLYFWVIGRYNVGAQSKTYISFLIDCDGVDLTSPVVSNVGTTDAQNWGYLIASPDGTKLASASASSGIEITDFDNLTGAISNPINLGTLNYSGVVGGNYGVCFSPNNKVLYASSITNWALVQWDLTAANIPGSKIYLGDLGGGGVSRPSYRGGALQLGPDGKIYVAETNLTSLGVIHNPNVIGAGCNLQNSAIDLAGKKCVLGLPPFIQSYFSTPSISYTNHCPGDQTEFAFSGASFVDSVKWSFDDVTSGANNASVLLSPAHTFTGAGTYNVRLIRYLNCIIDTIYQEVTIHAPVTSQQTIVLCENGTFELPDGQMATTEGTYTSTIQSVVTGCDSIVTTILTEPQTIFSAGISQKICKGTSAQLQAGQALNYTWTPSATLNDATVSNPIATPTETTTYTVSSQVQLSANLIVNGDFESGNTNFTSGYISSSPSPLGGPGNYTVSNAVSNSWWANCGDHTSGSGMMLIADGANGTNGVAGGASIWCQTIQVLPNTDYAFSTWLLNANSSGATSTLGFFINGTQIGQPQSTPLGLCDWNQFYVIWNSGTATTIDVCIAEMSGAQPGNDFAIDDISFYQICTITDTVTVNVSDVKLDVTTFENVDCHDNATGKITVDASGGFSPYSYAWNSGQTAASITGLTANTYSVTATDDNNCTKDTTLTITQPNELTASATANNIIECVTTNSGSATVTINGGTTDYIIAWDNQESTLTANQLSPGLHQVTVTDAHNCTTTASVTIEYKAPPTLNITVEDVCFLAPNHFTSQASIAAPETITGYQWVFSSSSSSQTSTVANPVETFGQYGTYTASLTVTSSNGCTTEKNASFEIYPNPVIGIAYLPECFQLINFDAEASHPDQLEMTYEWDLFNNNVIEETNKSFTQYFESAIPFDARLKVTDSRGCFSEEISTIVVVEGKADIEFPNILSMKSLVGNNQFDLEKVMPNFNSCINYTLRIFNRWGNMVFEVKNDISQPDLDCSHCFKGKTNAGKELTPGVYFYELEGEYDITKHGFITIVND